jgi:hypothetical protein
VNRRTGFRLGLALVVVTALAVGTAYWTARARCVEAGPGLRGEAKVLPNGKVLYFNGNCWTSRPVAPNDMPF